MINYKRLGKRVLVTAVALAAALAIALTGMYIYVSTHKTALKKLAEQKFADAFNGTLSIGSLEPDLWKQFPNVSLALHDVVIRDSAWASHHIDFINLKHAYLKLKFWPLLTGKVQLSKLLVTDGKMNLFVDAQNNSNKNIFAKPNKKKDKKGKANLNVRFFELERFTFTFTNAVYKKDFNFFIPNLSGRIDNTDGMLDFHTNGKIHVNKFIFNTEKGSYFGNKDLDINIRFFFDPKKNLLQLEKQSFNIDGYTLLMSGKFFTAKADNKFDVDISTNKVNFRTGLTWVPPTVRASLQQYIFEKPLGFKMHIEGRLKDQRIPFVAMTAAIVNNTLNSKFGKLDSLSFNLSYVNGSIRDSLYGDPYSFLRMTNLHATYAGIPVSADTTTVFNLINSKIKTHAKANFDLSKLNKLVGRESFVFTGGHASLDIAYEGGMRSDAKYPSTLSGRIHIQNAAFSYLPRRLNFHGCNVFLQVRNNDIEVAESVLKTERSEIAVTAISRNFIALYRSNPDEIVIDASVKSNSIDLNEFSSFLQSRGNARDPRKAPAKSSNSETPDFLDQALDVSRTNLTVSLKKIVYKKFSASDIAASLTLLPDGIDIHKASLNYSGGHIDVKGNLLNTDAARPTFNLETKVRETEIDKLLYSFDNFGQRTFKPENIRGTISLDAKINGALNSESQIVPRSLNGTTSFDIKQGALIQFKPLQKMGRLVFRKERLAEVRFERIRNTLTIRGNEINIPPMWVNTDLIDMQLEGIYRLDTGTNLLVEIPLFRFSKQDIAEDSTLSHNKGFRLYIQAKDNDEGEMKFSIKLRNKDISTAREERKKARDKRKQNKEKKP